MIPTPLSKRRRLRPTTMVPATIKVTSDVQKRLERFLTELPAEGRGGMSASEFILQSIAVWIEIDQEAAVTAEIAKERAVS